MSLCPSVSLIFDREAQGMATLAQACLPQAANAARSRAGILSQVHKARFSSLLCSFCTIDQRKRILSVSHCLLGYSQARGTLPVGQGFVTTVCPCQAGQGRISPEPPSPGQEEMASRCARAGLQWILRKNSSGKGCPGQWWSHHPSRHSKNVWM